MPARSLSVLLSCAALGAIAPGCGLSLDVDPPDTIDAGGAGDAGGGQLDAGPPDAAAPDASRPDASEPGCRSDVDCRDGLFCNGDETCQAGTCVGAPPSCPDPSPCMRAVCDEAADACMGAVTACPAGQICDTETGGCIPPPECLGDEDCGADENPCNGVEQCVGGTCAVSAPPLCAPTDGIPCTVPTCDPLAGHCVDVPNDSLCADEVDDCMFPVCGSDGCVLVPSDLACDDGHACTVDRCVPPSADGLPAECQHSPSPDRAICDDGASCTYDACNPAAPGADPEGCMHMPIDSSCTMGGATSACGSMECIGPEALGAYPSGGGCAPNLASDRCAPGTRCEMETAASMCVGFADWCGRDADCDDGNPCNGVEGCVFSRCARRTSGCPAPGPCRTSWCDLTSDPPTCRSTLDPSCTAP